MKYAIVIAAGASDVPLDDLDGRTPLEAALTPQLDQLAQAARLGTVTTTPEGSLPNRTSAALTVLGYDPRKHACALGPMLAASLGLGLQPTDSAIAVSLVCADDASEETPLALADLTYAETRELFTAISERWSKHHPGLASAMSLMPAAPAQGVLIDTSARGGDQAGGVRAFSGVRTNEPDNVLNHNWRAALPCSAKPDDTSAAASATFLSVLIEQSQEVLAAHPINRARAARNMPPVSLAWLHDIGGAIAMESFTQRFGVRGAIVTSSPLYAGIAASIGLDRIDPPGSGDALPHDLDAIATAACDALREYDLICCVISDADIASAAGDIDAKVSAIEAVDRLLIGPLAHALQASGDPVDDPACEGWRLLIMPDVTNSLGTGRVEPTPVPLLMVGAWVRSVVRRERFTEATAAASDLRINPGHELMEYFLRGGLAGVPTRLRPPAAGSTRITRALSPAQFGTRGQGSSPT